MSGTISDLENSHIQNPEFTEEEKAERLLEIIQGKKCFKELLNYFKMLPGMEFYATLLTIGNHFFS